MDQIEATFVGTAPLIMHNGRMVDPEDPWTQKLASYTAKKKKTDEDKRMISRVEWRGSLYWDEERECVALPADLIWAVVVAGAMKRKLGPKAKAGIVETAPSFPLSYDGPKTLDGLEEDEAFRLRKRVVISRSAVIRTRPIFRDWRCTIGLLVDSSLISISDVEQALQDAGEQVGIGDWRPRFGRFEIEGFKQVN